MDAPGWRLYQPSVSLETRDWRLFPWQKRGRLTQQVRSLGYLLYGVPFSACLSDYKRSRDAFVWLSNLISSLTTTRSVSEHHLNQHNDRPLNCSLASDVFDEAPCTRNDGNSVTRGQQTSVSSSPALALHQAIARALFVAMLLLRGTWLALRFLSSWDLYTIQQGCALFRPSVNKTSIGRSTPMGGLNAWQECSQSTLRACGRKRGPLRRWKMPDHAKVTLASCL